MRYSVTIMDFAAGVDPRDTWHYFDGVSLRHARWLAERAARRGVKRYGGGVRLAPWGALGGDWPNSYRAATISADKD